MTAANRELPAPPPRRAGARLLAAVVPGAAFVLAAAAMVAVLRSTAPHPLALGLTAWGGKPGTAKPLADGAAVRAGTPVHLALAPTGACPLWLVAVDAAGRVERIHPIVPAPQRLPALDVEVRVSPSPGPQRFFALCDPDDALDYAHVLAAAGAAARDGAEGLRAARALAGLPPGTRQASLLVEAM